MVKRKKGVGGIECSLCFFREMASKFAHEHGFGLEWMGLCWWRGEFWYDYTVSFDLGGLVQVGRGVVLIERVWISVCN